MTKWIDFDQLIYLQFDHAPGYAQWWVMLNLGLAKAPDEKSSSIVIQRFASREVAEKYKSNIYHACIKHEHANKHPAYVPPPKTGEGYNLFRANGGTDEQWDNPTQNPSFGKRVMYSDGTPSREYEDDPTKTP